MSPFLGNGIFRRNFAQRGAGEWKTWPPRGSNCRAHNLLTMLSCNSANNGASYGAILGSVVADCFTTAVLMADRNGRILLCTPAAEKALRLKAGRRVLSPALKKLVRDCLTSDQSLPPRKISRAVKGAQGSLAASAAPVRRGRNTEVAIVLHDLLPLRSVEENLRRLDRLAVVGTLSASAGHEIKNALVAVKTFLDLLLEKNRDAELGGVVQREMQRIDLLVGQMMRFARPARPVFSDVRLHEVINHSLRMVQHQLDDKLISLNRSFQAAPDFVRGDDGQLEQVFVNLFINALEAMGPNGSLKVATEFVSSPFAAEKKSPQVRVTISDTGVGVAPENIPQLFEPFFTTKQNGTGLGLPIIQRIVREHQGDISVQSELNQGTTFSILLPATAKSG